MSTSKSRVIDRVRGKLSPLLTASQRRDLADAIRLAHGGKSAAKKGPPTSITSMPGFSPMQLRQRIDRVVQVRQEIEVMSKQWESVLAKLKDLEREEAEGLKALNEAGKRMREKGRMCAEAETGLLEFTAYLKDVGPGIAQMIARPEDSKFGDKAGDFFGRVAAKFGAEVGEGVETLYEQCKEDLTHVADAVRGLKIIEKTSSVPQAVTKEAGLADVVVGVKEWLSGTTNSIAKRIMNFAGDIKRWVKGFVERTKIAKKAAKQIAKATSQATAGIEKLLASEI